MGLGEHAPGFYEKEAGFFERSEFYGHHWFGAKAPAPPRFNAVKHVGFTTDENARWLLDFVEEDLEHAPPARLREATEELVTFTFMRSRTPFFASEVQTLGLQTTLRTGIENLRAKKPFALSLRDVVTGVAWDETGALVSVRKGKAEAAFFMAVFDLLREVGSRLGVCRNAKCGRLFLVPHGRKQYCRPACSQAVRTEKFRKAHPDRVSDMRHVSYERKQKKKLGPKVKVGRRPRKRKEG